MNTMKIYRVIPLLAAICHVYALVSTVRIVGITGSGTQYLPSSYVQNFPRWTPTTEACDASSEEMKIRATADFLVKDGVPTYFMVGLQVMQKKVTHELAQQWTAFGISAEPGMRIEVFAGPGDGSDELVIKCPNEVVRKSLETLGNWMSTEMSEEMTNGFHIISLPLSEEWHAVKDKGDSSAITCFATAEPDARELFSLDESLIEMTASSTLSFKISELLQGPASS